MFAVKHLPKLHCNGCAIVPYLKCIDPVKLLYILYIQSCAEVFSPQRNGFKPVIYIFCSVSVGNISLQFQTLIVPLIVIIQ